MSEIIRTGMQLAPYIGAATGLVGGAIAEHRVQRQITKEAVVAAEVMGEANSNVAKIDSKSVRIAKRLMGPLALTGALAGGVAGYAVAPQESLPAPEAGVQLVVDRSGATAFGGSELTPAKNIEKVVASLDEQDNFKITAHVAHSSSVETTSIEDVESIKPFGDATMREAFMDATENVSLSDTDETTDNPSKNPAIVVLTNGNPVGKTGTAIEKANRAGSPVYVVNVGEDIDNSAEESLQKITDETHGQYWDIEETDIPEVPNMVSSEVSPAPEQPGSGSKIPEKLFALLGLAAWGMAYRYRRNQPLTFNGSNVNEGEK